MDATKRESVRTGGVRLPWALYEMLRLQAYERHISQNVIFTEALTEHFEVLPKLRDLVSAVSFDGPLTGYDVAQQMKIILGSGGEEDV